jgi:hypothetical protein
MGLQTVVVEGAIAFPDLAVTREATKACETLPVVVTVAGSFGAEPASAPGAPWTAIIVGTVALSGLTASEDAAIAIGTLAVGCAVAIALITVAVGASVAGPAIRVLEAVPLTLLAVPLEASGVVRAVEILLAVASA